MNVTALSKARGRLAGIIAAACLVGMSATALYAQGAAQATAPKVAIVLGNAPKATDEPTTAQTARCLKGLELYRNGTVNTLLVTGGFTLDHISEARMMKIALVTWGMPPGDIIEDEMAATTRENASFSARIFEQRGWPKTAWIVSQKFHLPRAGTAFKENGFQVQDAASADAAAVEDFSPLPDMKPGTGVKADPSDLIVVHEPYSSTEPVEWPTPQLAHRLRVAAALYHQKAAPAIILSNDPYTRGPVNIAQMMKIALVSLGVPAEKLTVLARGQYRGLTALARASGDKSATILTSSAAKISIPPDLAGKWKTLIVD